MLSSSQKENNFKSSKTYSLKWSRSTSQPVPKSSYQTCDSFFLFFFFLSCVVLGNKKLYYRQHVQGKFCPRAVPPAKNHRKVWQNDYFMPPYHMQNGYSCDDGNYSRGYRRGGGKNFGQYKNNFKEEEFSFMPIVCRYSCLLLLLLRYGSGDDDGTRCFLLQLFP